MNPYEHYKEAERCLAQAQDSLEVGEDPTYWLASAQINATLATCGDLSGAWEK